jgi:immune inhibitor A
VGVGPADPRDRQSGRDRDAAAREGVLYGNGSWGLSATSTPNNTAGAIRDAIVAADPQVDWGPFDMDHDGFVDMLWVIHSGLPGEATQARDNLWSITSRLTAWSGTGAYSTNDPIPGVPFSHIRIDRFSILPELSAFRPGQRSEIGVFCHEFGHALGSAGSLRHLDARCLGQRRAGRLVAHGDRRIRIGWLRPRVSGASRCMAHAVPGMDTKVRPTLDSLITMGPIENGHPIIELWFQGESNSEHFLIENRRRLSFDRNLRGEGLLLYHVDDAAIGLGIPANRVIGGANRAMELIPADGQPDLINGPQPRRRARSVPRRARCDENRRLHDSESSDVRAGGDEPRVEGHHADRRRHEVHGPGASTRLVAGGRSLARYISAGRFVRSGDACGTRG